MSKHIQPYYQVQYHVGIVLNLKPLKCHCKAQNFSTLPAFPAEASGRAASQPESLLGIVDI